MRADPRKDKTLLAAIADIIGAQRGALIVRNDPNRLAFLFSGGMRLDLPFTSQQLYELAKMDGAIIVNAPLTKLVYANVQLMPDPAIPSDETGTRHRTAQRVAKQTDAMVVSISQQRETVTLFIGDLRYQRAEMTTRMAEEIERNCVELGEEGRLIRMQLDELMEEVPREKAAVVYDYEQSGDPSKAAGVLEGLAKLPHPRLLEFEELAELLGYPRDVNPIDLTVSPRGYRVLSRIPRLPDSVIRHVVRDFASLDAVVRASHRDLEAVDGVGAVRAREIREGLRRLQEHNLVDRYLQL